MDADTRLAEIAESHPGDWYSGEWRTEYIDSTTDEPSYYVVKHQESGTVLAELPDWAGPIALFIADAHDAVPALLARIADLEATLERYVGKEPTVADEMAYLNRCLNAVFEVCREADADGNTADGKFTPAAVQQAASGEREDRPDDRRRRLYMDGEGQAWIDASVTSDGTRWIAPVNPAGNQMPEAYVRNMTGEIHEIGRTW